MTIDIAKARTTKSSTTVAEQFGLECLRQCRPSASPCVLSENKQESRKVSIRFVVFESTEVKKFQDLALENPVKTPKSSLSPSHSVYSNSKTHNSSFSPCSGGLLLPHHFGLVSLSIHVSEQLPHAQYRHSSLTLSAGFLYHSPPTSSQAGSNQLKRPCLCFYPMYNTARLCE